jgi:hypothetical protein
MAISKALLSPPQHDASRTKDTPVTILRAGKSHSQSTGTVSAVCPEDLVLAKEHKKHSIEDAQCRERRGVSVIPVCHFFR